MDLMGFSGEVGQFARGVLTRVLFPLLRAGRRGQVALARRETQHRPRPRSQHIMFEDVTLCVKVLQFFNSQISRRAVVGKGIL